MTRFLAIKTTHNGFMYFLQLKCEPGSSLPLLSRLLQTESSQVKVGINSLPQGKIQLLCRYIGIYIFYNKFFILTQGLGYGMSDSLVNIINLFCKFIYVFLCFKMKYSSSSWKGACMLHVNLLRRDFLYFSFNSD